MRIGRDAFGVRGFFFHHYATHQARLRTNRNYLAVLLRDPKHGKGGHRAGGHNKLSRPQLRFTSAHTFVFHFSAV